MNNLKKENIRKAIWHIKRHCDNIQSSLEETTCNHELFHLQTSVDFLNRVINTSSLSMVG